MFSRDSPIHMPPARGQHLQQRACPQSRNQICRLRDCCGCRVHKFYLWRSLVWFVAHSKTRHDTEKNLDESGIWMHLAPGSGNLQLIVSDCIRSRSIILGSHQQPSAVIMNKFGVQFKLTELQNCTEWPKIYKWGRVLQWIVLSFYQLCGAKVHSTKRCTVYQVCSPGWRNLWKNGHCQDEPQPKFV